MVWWDMQCQHFGKASVQCTGAECTELRHNAFYGEWMVKSGVYCIN
jgi:hypothetical protein